MKKNKLLMVVMSLLAGVLLLQGCATAPVPYDYSTYMANMPRSILVLPPVNESTEVMAPYIYLSTVTHPLAERGYYVFPVAVVDMLMKENGVPSPEEMAMVPLDKIQEIIGPDAVLYMTVVEWGTKYQILDSVTIVHVRGRLVDTDTGTTLWEGEHTVRRGSSSNQNSLVAMLVAAIINQIVGNLVDYSREVAYTTNYQLFYNPHRGLLAGGRSSSHEADLLAHRTTQNQAVSEPSAP